MSGQERVQKRIRAIVKYFGAEFFHGIKILDIGSGDGTVARAFADMGAKVTCVDARKSQLDAIYVSNPSIRCIRADLDQEWPFRNDFFELTLHLGTLNHLMYIEKHLQFICSNTNYLVLDTQVCDSSKANKYVLVKENRSNVEHSFNGVGCRPSPAFVERILSEAGMQFEMLNDTSCNSGRHVYDWVGKDSNSIQSGISRLWFARRHALKAMVTAPIKELFSHSPRWIPPKAILPSPTPAVAPIAGSIDYTSPISPVDYGSDPIKKTSQDFALVFPETFSTPLTFTTSGIILPLTSGSRTWVQKIQPFFPNLRVHHLAHTMRDFVKSKSDPDLVMCSITNLYKAKRLWIEEWSNHNFSTTDIAILRSCEQIMTPSIVNEHDILRVIPDAKIKKIERSWPLLNVDVTTSAHYIYFEKDPNHTKLLAGAWLPEFGKLIAVGATVKIPTDFELLPNTENYIAVCEAVRGSKAIIDLTTNTYYKSGTISLAKAYGIPVISTNQYGSERRHSIIHFDRAISEYPSAQDVQKAVRKFNNNILGRENFIDSNIILNSSLKKLIGTND